MNKLWRRVAAAAKAGGPSGFHPLRALKAESAPQVTAAYSVQGYVDAIEGDLVRGWVVDPNRLNCVMRVGLLVDGHLIAECLAGESRLDLSKAGLGDGHHGFSLRLPDDANDLRRARAVVVELGTGSTLQNGDFLFDPAAVRWSRIALGLRSQISRLSSLLASGRPQKPPHRPSWDSRLIGFNTRARVERLLEPVVHGEPFAAQVSAYSHFLHHRMRLDDSNPLLSERDRNEHLLWYVEEYGYSRRQFRIPLSAEQIAYLNQRCDPLAFPFPVSRFMAHHYLAHPKKGFGLHEEDSYLEFCYWWVSKRAVELNVSDCLVPDYVSARMARAVSHPRHPQFTISEFMFRHWREHFAKVTPAPWDLTQPEGILAFTAAFAVGCIEQPWQFEYLPASARRFLFEPQAHDPAGRSLLDVLVDAALAGPSSFLVDPGGHRRLEVGSGIQLGIEKRIEAVAAPRAQGGHRIESLQSPRHPREMCDGVTVFGPSGVYSGLGAAARRTAALLREAGEVVYEWNFDLDNPSTRVGPQKQYPSELPEGCATRINILHLNADTLPLAIAYLPAYLFEQSYNVGAFYWELSQAPACHRLAQDVVDEIWSASNFVADVYRRTAKVPVQVMGLGVEADHLGLVKPLDRRRFNLDPDACVFLSTYDSFSFIDRKNPAAVLQTFHRAFPVSAGDRVQLVVKTQNGERTPSNRSQRGAEQLLEAASRDPRILLINETLVTDEFLSFKAACDCYVSLFRSEGFGLGPAEAMALGIPVIATDYSGVRDFVAPGHALPVRCREVPVRHDEYIHYTPGDVWAEPDIEHAAELMRMVAQDPVERRRIGRAGQAFALAHLGTDKVAPRYAARLSSIREILSKADSVV